MQQFIAVCFLFLRLGIMFRVFMFRKFNLQTGLKLFSSKVIQTKKNKTDLEKSKVQSLLHHPTQPKEWQVNHSIKMWLKNKTNLKFI